MLYAISNESCRVTLVYSDDPNEDVMLAIPWDKTNHVLEVSIEHLQKLEDATPDGMEVVFGIEGELEVPVKNLLDVVTETRFERANRS